MPRRTLWLAAAAVCVCAPAWAGDGAGHGAQSAPSGMSPGDAFPEIDVRYSRPGGGTIDVPSNAPQTRPNRFSLSPSYNTNFANEPRNHAHQATETTLRPDDDQWYAAWGNGFILGTEGNYPTGRPYPIWFPYGHWEYREVRVWIPPRWVEEYVPAEYGYQLVRGRRVPVLLRPARVIRRQLPGHYEARVQRVWTSHFVGGFHRPPVTSHPPLPSFGQHARPAPRPETVRNQERHRREEARRQREAPPDESYQRNSILRTRIQPVDIER